MLGIATPSAGLAAPTPAATPTPAPQRAPAVTLSPSATPRPAASPAATAAPTPAPTAVVPTPTPAPTDDASEAEVDWRAFVPTDTADHLATMASAARDSNCGVPWQLLAAIARVESDFGRNMNTSTAGAIGYGQFLPSSWQAFGSDGNAYDYRVALPAIAQYLCAAGLARDPRAALFAYNHADWYVDLVLDLAVRYDRMAPGAPIPAVLNVGPDQQEAVPMQYAQGRDLQLQTRQRSLESHVSWLGVPWRGRTTGQSIAADAMQSTTIAMLRAGFGLRGDAPPAAEVGTSQDLDGLTNSAWAAGLLGEPATGEWSIAELHRRLSLGQPVVVYVASKGLPGHPSGSDDGEQPLVLIGSTPDGFVYNDPSFSSSLGYGLEMTDAQLLDLWGKTLQPHQALGFVAARRSLARSGHLAAADPPEPIARVTATPTRTSTPVPTATATPVPPPPTAVLLPTFEPVAAAPVDTQPPSNGVDLRSVAAAFLLLGGAAAIGLRLRRARPTAS